MQEGISANIIYIEVTENKSQLGDLKAMKLH